MDHKPSITEGTDPAANDLTSSASSQPLLQNGGPHSPPMMDDPDRCRICRGDATEEEELFYPCKCNGSIRYVHQSCLVDWLSHSQKKHCELCKTPFRFTKLYDANMPQSVPVPVFLRQAAMHAGKSLVTYLRFHLVVFTWLFWLPWCMRAVWRGLFWVGDGGWVDWNKRNMEAFGITSAAVEHHPTIWSRTYSTITTAPEALASLLMSGFSTGLRRQEETVEETFQAYDHEPLSFRLIRSVYHLLVGNSTLHPSRDSFAAESSIPTSRPASWLSEVPFLKSLTRSSIFNNIIIDTLEGQIITMCLVVVLIVMFLIREWVVQQQQNILMAPEDRQLANVRAAVERQIQEQAPDNLRGRDNDNARADEADLNVGQRRVLQPRGRLQRRATHPEGQPLNVAHHRRAATSGNDLLATHNDDTQASILETDISTSFKRPTLPQRGTTSGVEIQRNLNNSPEEHVESLQTQSSHSRGSSPGTEPQAFGAEGETTPSVDEAAIKDNIEPEIGHDHANRPNTSEREQQLSAMLSSNAEPLFPASHPEDHADVWHLDQPALVDVPIQSDSRPASQRQTHPVLAFPPQRTFTESTHQSGLEHEPETSAPSNTPISTAPGSEQDNNERRVQPPAETAMPARSLGRSFLDWLMDLMWGQPDMLAERLEPSTAAVQIEDEEHIVGDIADEAPFVPAHRRQQVLQDPTVDGNNGQDQPDHAAADAPGGGNDEQNPEDAFDDLEDMEGVMELVGMQGPILGLAQNGIFCALLISLAISAALWIPYMLGKGLLIVIARPLYVLQQPLQFASTAADMIVDFCIFAMGCSYYWLDMFARFVCSPVWMILPASWHGLQSPLLPRTAKAYAENALRRLALASMANGELVSKILDVPRLSIVAHESLRTLTGTASSSTAYVLQSLTYATNGLKHVFSENTTNEMAYIIRDHFVLASQRLLRQLSTAFNSSQFWIRPHPMRIRLFSQTRAQPIDPALAAWSSRDRAIAIAAGYIFLFILGVLYLRVIAALKGTNKKGRVNDVLAELLYQIGGVLKVILIISIEMIVFPLYCGILLDAALLPLFNGATFGSRITFATRSPNTAFFIHWFVGTCYMFHFALFVSMCRKIFRTGVLFFIRDPDDPTFHPVRDVLERNVSTQLWKISFSGLVYGALILACLGAIVWSIAAAPLGVFPIRWSSTEPILEFPVDILFYNFLVPVAVKYCKPANGLTSVYGWWFHKCGRWLRLSSFLFQENHSDEMGTYVSRTWAAAFRRITFRVPQTDGENADIQFRRDVRKVKAPSSDQLRIPKGHPTLFQLDENTDRPVVTIHSNSAAFLDQNIDSFETVYVPPWFRLRIAILACFVWAFATATGFSATILPLLIGRRILAMLSPNEVYMNDIYAVCLGLYLLGGSIFAGLRLYRSRGALLAKLSLSKSAVKTAAHKAAGLSIVAMKAIYTYGAFTIFLPALISIAIECYIIIPLFTLFASKEDASDAAIAAAVRAPLYLPPSTANTASVLSRPVVHLIQDWTIGILYVKVVGRLILWSAPSRPATALRRIVRNGWFYPDVWLATRGFILPSAILLGLLLALPLSLGWLAIHVIPSSRIGHDDYTRSCIYRYSYPVLLVTVIAACLLVLLGRAFAKWRKKVRDEVYLIGERLHNYGETKKIKGGVDKGKGKEIVERPVLENGGMG